VAICDEHLADSPTHLLEAIFLAVEGFSRGRGPHDDMAAALFTARSDFPFDISKEIVRSARWHGTSVRVPKQQCSFCASRIWFPIDSLSALQ
jgi:hypothetical protein